MPRGPPPVRELARADEEQRRWAREQRELYEALYENPKVEHYNLDSDEELQVRMSRMARMSR